MNIKRLMAIGAVAVAALLMMAGAVGADTYATGFESPTFNLGTVDGQDGWHSAVPGDIPALPNGYDQAVVDNSSFGSPVGFGAQSLRLSNAYTEPSGEFFFQTYSKSTTDPAGESQTNTVFDGQFQFISTSASEQTGLHVSVSPDNGVGARMSYVSLDDTATGIQITFYDTDAAGNFVGYVAGTYARNVVHTVRFLIQTVPGEANDILRLYVDGVDIGDKLGVCFTTWESYYRAAPPVGEGHEPGVIDSFEFRSAGNGITLANLIGGGYLFDNVTTATRNTAGPAPTNCGAVGAFCSPGFWKNASDAAWALTGIDETAEFNKVVVPSFYVNPISPGTTTLSDVLTAKGANTFGKAAGPFGLNPFNAVGAALTNAIPGYVFDPDAYAQSLLGIDTCPIDHHGNVIDPA